MRVYKKQKHYLNCLQNIQKILLLVMKHWYTILSQNVSVLTESGDHQRVQNVLVLQNDFEL